MSAKTNLEAKTKSTNAEALSTGDKTEAKTIKIKAWNAETKAKASQSQGFKCQGQGLE